MHCTRGLLFIAVLLAGGLSSPAANQWVVNGGVNLIPPANAGVITQAEVGQTDLGWAVGLRSNGTVLVWGDVGDTLRTIPANLSGVVQVAAGSSHVVALLSNGTVRAWGINGYGQASVPAGLTGVVQVAAGAQHSLALRSNGTVRAWGQNLSGQCNVPAGLSNVVRIVARESQSMALRADGSVVAWGVHGFGQAQNLAPPAGMGPAIDIAAGLDFCCALRADGQIVTWTATPYAVTNPPITVSNAVAIYASSGGTAAMLADGRVVRIQTPTNYEFALPGPAVGFSLGKSGNWLAVLASPVYRRTRSSVPQDYDGDGRTDVAAFHPGSATWYIQRSSDGQPLGGGPLTWGTMNSFAVPADYDGDGKADLATYDRNTGNWLIRCSSNLTTLGGGPINHGGPSYVPVPQDYDGDGRADLAIMHFDTGSWYIWQSSNSNLLSGGAIPFRDAAYGNPVFGDFDGDGLADPAVAGRWGFYCLLSRSGGLQATEPLSEWGEIAPVSADFNGDGVCDQAAWRWKTTLGELGTVLRAGTWLADPPRYLATTTLGNAYTLPAVGDYDGDGISDQAVFSTYTRRWQIYSSRTHQQVGGLAGVRWPTSRVSGLIPADPQYQVNRMVGSQP